MVEEGKTKRIKDLHAETRPRERLEALGASALTDAELLAILLGTGTTARNAIELGNDLLQDLNGLAGIHQASLSRLQEYSGISLAKAAKIKAALELSNRLLKSQSEEKARVSNPEDVVTLVGHDLRGQQQEELWVLSLNVRKHVIAKQRLYRGTQAGSSVRVGEVFTEALRKDAHSLIVVHNHPSGDSSPSPEDVNLTRYLVDAGKILDLKVEDHIIIGRTDYHSIRQQHPEIWQ